MTGALLFCILGHYCLLCRIVLPEQMPDAAPHQCSGNSPGNRKDYIQHGETLIHAEYREDPQNSDKTGAGDGLHGREQRFSVSPEISGRYFVQAAQRGQEDDDPDPFTGGFDYRRIR